jgi:hypothetical protein
MSNLKNPTCGLYYMCPSVQVEIKFVNKQQSYDNLRKFQQFDLEGQGQFKDKVISE